MAAGQRLASGNVFVQKGEDPTTLVIAFNSGFRYVGMRPNEFELSPITESMRCSRIHCKDPQFLWYHGGIDEEHPDIHSVIRLLRELVADLAPDVLITAGASAGGYAALLFGHFLHANYVHAFGPNTSISEASKRLAQATMKSEIWRMFESLWSCPSADPQLFDLATVLSEHNGRTRYCIHYCARAEKDCESAAHVRELPGVELFAHRCNDHYIALHLAHRKLLGPTLRPENQPHLEQVLSRFLLTRAAP